MDGVRALLLSEHDLPAWAASYRQGLRPTLLPYGIEALHERGYELGSLAVTSGRLGTKARSVVEHRLGMPVEQPARAVLLAAQSDVVIALLERNALAPAWAKRLRLWPYSRRPLVVWSCWLADELARLDRAGRAQVARTLSHADLIVHLSQTETDIFLDAGFAAEQLFAMTYGVASEFYTPASGLRDIDILAVGQDRGRDYGTLFEAVDGTDLHVEVVCRPENLQGLTVPSNVTLRGTVDHVAYRDLIRRAKVLAVPTIEAAYPTGSSVALEASSCGTCVVVTGTRAMRQYFTHDVNALLVDVGDADGWRSSLRLALKDSALRDRLGAAARRLVVDKHNTRHMWFEIDDALAARGILPMGGDR